MQSDDDHNLYQFFTDQSLNQSSNRSPEHRSNINSPEQDFNSHFDVEEIWEGELTQIQQDQDETIKEDQVTYTATQ